jgi:two-component system, LytTR family, response regulator
MEIKTIVVDDEPHAIDIILKYLAEFDEVKVIGTCPNAMKAFQLLQREQVDLMFLDIKMPGLSGTELMRSLKDPPRVIFTTAFKEYAVDGFDLDATDYLLKPISFDRFLKAMDKVYQSMGNAEIKGLPQPPVFGNQEVSVYIKVDRNMIKVSVDDILWIESIRDYLKVILKNKVLITKQKISILETLLPENKFLRIHRSFIIALSKIDRFNSSFVQIGDNQLPIGRNYKSDSLRVLRHGSVS